MTNHMSGDRRDNPFATIIKNHRARVGRVYDRFMDRIASIRKRKIETMKEESARADEDRLAEIRKSLEDNR